VALSAAANEEERENERGYSQAVRIFAVLTAIAPSTNGVSVTDIHHEVNQSTGEEWNRRTIIRDLNFLVSMGYCSIVKVNRGLRLYIINRTDGKFPTYLFPI
jgi:Fe2+ or Zn2+ uptake regulation protein